MAKIFQSTEAALRDLLPGARAQQKMGPGNTTAKYFIALLDTHPTESQWDYPLSFIPGILGVIFVYIFVKLGLHLYRTRNDTPLKDVPGPWLASCSPLYRFWYAVVKGNFHNDLTNLHRKYGNVVRIAPNEVSVWDPRAASEIYAHGDKGYPKCDMYDIALPNGFFNLAVERDIQKHAEGRRAIARDYTMTATLTAESHFDNIIRDFILALDKNFAQKGSVCDFTIWSEYFTYDMITDLVFGEAYGFCKTGLDFDGSLKDLRQMLNLSPFLSYLPWIWPITQNPWIKKIGMNHYARNVKANIMKRLNNGNFSGHRDLLDGLIESRLAAPDTASVALRAILINLVCNRDVYNAVMDELTGLKLSNPATWKELADAPLLHATVKETLRLHPPAGFNLPRAVPAGGRTVCGYHLPEGTTVGMSAWCVHANEDFWGKDALEFKPQRWLDPENAFKFDRYGLSFGQGARACLGKNIAMVQLVKVAAQILLNFEFELVDENKIREMFLLLVVLDGVKIAFKRRAGGPLDDTIGMEGVAI
ncbi:cytochrome P450 [Tuber magnatum]|uniref:Cytochrome P450 n=1 Tax=Tuber magnatum TaxID=42249 RepID=A0A317SMZ7_9PEZI|nr:cytochrome P450 [Tuber magnatum]